MNHETRFFVLFSLAVFIVTAPAQAQMGFGMGFKVGQNQSHFATNDFENRNLKTVCGGLAVQFSLMGLFSIEADALYSTKGCVLKQGTLNEEIRLKTLSIPIVLKKKFLPVAIHPFVLGGMEYSTLLSASRQGRDIKNLLVSSETSVVMGAGLEFSLLGKAVFVEGRYNHGLDDLYKETAQGKIRNRVTQIFFGMFL